MSTATPQKPPASERRPLLPPPETFWKTYSARHEFPLSTAFSIFMHALAIGLILLVGYLAQLRWYRPENKPPENDVVSFAGDSSLAGGGGPAGAPGDGKMPAEAFLPGTLDKIYDQPFAAESTDTSGLELNPEALQSDAKEVDDDITEILKKAGKEIPDKPKITPPLMAKAGAKAKEGGVGGVKGGAFGSGGKGFGTGKGDGVGPGSGPGKFGKALTRQEFLALRWNFDLSGSPKIHLNKLVKVGFIVGLEAADGRFYTVSDTKRRPAEIKVDTFEKYKEAVKWHNVNADSVAGVIKEMGLTLPVKRIFLFLPKEREEQLVQEEVRYAKSIGRALNSFDFIWFDFQERDSRYEPVALRVGSFPGKGAP